jgi:hypothetical protein
MATLRQVGDMASALYYQNYKTDESFFDLAHFKFLLATKYNELLLAEFNANKKLNKILTGFSWYEISPSWLVEETVTPVWDCEKNQYVATLSQNVFEFDYDAMSSGVQYVRMLCADCGNVVRITQRDLISLCYMPVNAQIMYYVKGDNKLVFVNGNCDLSKQKFEVFYVPAVDCLNDDSAIHDDKVNPMIIEVLNLMFGAKNGNFVDMTNDSNPNTSAIKEIGNINALNKQ